MRVEGTFVILTPGFAASEEDSTCLPMQQTFVRMLYELYPQIKIVILSFQYPYHQKKYQWFDATVYSFNGRNRGGIARLLLREKVYARLKEIHRSDKIIGLLSFWYGECAYVGNRFGDKHHIKHRCWLLGQDARQMNQYPKRIPLQSHELIAVSDFIQAEFERNHGRRPAVVIPPVVNLKNMVSPVVERDIDILATGSLIPLKQFALLPEIVVAIKNHIPSVNVQLIGEGPEKAKLQHLIKQYSLAENLQLIGELRHKKVLQTMQRARVFLHPSSYEGFSVACLEALYSGAHVISFVQPMKREIKNWHIVKTKEEMAQKAIDILKDPDTPYEKTMVFTPEDIVQKIIGLFISEEM
ncbi:MAG: glycosyltransferase family 4 protein [Chitinophagaceae bacterium]|nr:glycosyltransferase family 4 protein [Chitinophagaceae bacterium]